MATGRCAWPDRLTGEWSRRRGADAPHDSTRRLRKRSPLPVSLGANGERTLWVFPVTQCRSG